MSKACQSYKKKKKNVQLLELKRLSNEIELGFETFWNFERFIIICKILQF